MSSDAVAVRVENLGKRYEIYNSPRDRLKQFVFPRLNRFIGRKQYHYFQEFWALRDISFEVKKGEAFGIVGRNGSGKSTLLQIVTGTLSPTTGNVTTIGRITALLELGSGFNPEFSGRENVYMNGMLLGLTREDIDERFDDIASFADIGEFLERPVKTYSSGMLVRLAFAVQVQLDPDILIVDEALAVGDALFQKRCFQRIEKLLSSGVTLFFVSHDQESIRTLTHRVLLLNQGRAVVCGTPADVMLAYRKQLHDEESAYFAAITERIAKARSKRRSEQGEEWVRSAEGLMPEEQALAGIGRSSEICFGDGGVHIVGVSTYSFDRKPCKFFYPGDRLSVCVECASNIDIERINVSIRIRNKEGLKIYSWGTLNQDMKIIARLEQGEIFWQKRIREGERFAVWFDCEQCPIGPNLYEIQAAISYEDKPDYSAQRILHWMDEAAFFQVLMRQDQYFFGGLADLRMKAYW